MVDTTQFYGLIKTDVICQAISRNPAEQKVGANGMALNLSTFVYLEYRHWRYMHAERELVNKFRMFDRGNLSVQVLECSRG